MLTAMSLAFDGDWTVPVDGNKRWSGTVHADRPFVALLVAETGRRLFWAKTEVCDPPAPITFDVHPLRDPSHVQPIMKVRDGFLQDVTVFLRTPDSVVLPTLPKVGEAGLLLRAFVVPSDPETTFSMMLLARDDVRVGRTGVWRPKAAIQPLLPSIVVIPLYGGRKGVVDRAV